MSNANAYTTASIEFCRTHQQAQLSLIVLVLILEGSGVQGDTGNARLDEKKTVFREMGWYGFEKYCFTEVKRTAACSIEERSNFHGVARALF